MSDISHKYLRLGPAMVADRVEQRGLVETYLLESEVLPELTQLRALRDEMADRACEYVPVKETRTLTEQLRDCGTCPPCRARKSKT